MKIQPIVTFRGFRWFFKRDLYTVRKIKWGDPAAYTPSQAVIKKTIEAGGLSIGVRYTKWERKASRIKPSNNVVDTHLVTGEYH